MPQRGQEVRHRLLARADDRDAHLGPIGIL